MKWRIGWLNPEDVAKLAAKNAKPSGRRVIKLPDNSGVCGIAMNSTVILLEDAEF